MDLEVPRGNLFDRVVRVDRLMERLDVQAPEVGGWLHKEVKRRPQHLEKHHVTEFSVGASGGVVKLRVGPDGTGAGFDVLFSKEAPRVRMLARADQQDGRASSRSTSTTTTRKKLLALHDKLAEAAPSWPAPAAVWSRRGWTARRCATHAKPTLLAERLIAKMAPVVQEIAARSQSPGELVLRRLLGGDRREEIFLSKAELKQKLDRWTTRTARCSIRCGSARCRAPSAKAAPVETAPAAGSAPHTQTGKYRPMTPALGVARVARPTGTRRRRRRRSPRRRPGRRRRAGAARLPSASTRPRRRHATHADRHDGGRGGAIGRAARGFGVEDAARRRHARRGAAARRRPAPSRRPSPKQVDPASRS